jgi:predicted ABC-type ATPase
VASKRPIRSSPRCVVIAGPNGAGKTTFARQYLPQETTIVHFINADLIAAGLSPLAPAGAALRAGRLVISEIERLSRDRESFAFEAGAAMYSVLNP